MWIKRNIQAAINQIPCDLVIKNIKVVDVFQQEIFLSDVGIMGGEIVGIGEFQGEKEIDGTGKYICPGLMDAHMHIESSLVTPREYCKMVLPHGVTMAIADPHEIANVMGTKGIEWMLERSQDLPFDYYFMMPSCVPATTFEHAGATLESKDLAPYYKHPMVLGLAEVMNYPSVFTGEADMMQKLISAKDNHKLIDGHGAGFSPTMVNGYRAAGILTDHECHTVQGVIDRLRRGMYVLIREGTVAKNLKTLIGAVKPANSRRLCFCTDDKHLDDIVENGSIDDAIRKAIKSGIDPVIAIQMATINPSECYRLYDYGAIAPGYKADFLILSNLEEFQIEAVYKAGQLVVENHAFIGEVKDRVGQKIENSVHLPSLKVADLAIEIQDKAYLNIIEIIPNQLETRHVKIPITTNERYFKSDPEKELLKIVVVERHQGSGNIGKGIVKGMGLEAGALATSIAHDSHNLIVTGTNDDDMLIALEALQAMGGGIVVVNRGVVLASLALEVAGLMTNAPYGAVKKDLEKIHHSLKELAPNLSFNPLLTLAFLSLPVIPDIKITDQGVFDVKAFRFIEVAE